MQVLDGPKTLILMSEGFGLTDDGMANELGGAGGGDADEHLRAEARQPAVRDHQLAGARLSNRDQRAQRRRSRRWPPRRAARCSSSAAPAASCSRSIESELSGYYLLGVESDPDRPRRQAASDSHRRVAPRRDGADAAAAPERAGRPQPAAQSPREAIAASLTAPLLMSALPLRVATFALRGPEQSQGAAADSRRRRHRLHRRQAARGSATSSWIGPAGSIESPPAVQMASAAGDERRAGRAAVLGRREPRSGRVHHQARGRRRRSGRQRRASDARGARGSRRGHAERADGRRTGRRPASSCVRRSATPSASARCTDISRPTGRTWSRWPRSTRSRRPRTARR